MVQLHSCRRARWPVRQRCSELAQLHILLTMPPLRRARPQLLRLRDVGPLACYRKAGEGGPRFAGVAPAAPTCATLPQPCTAPGNYIVHIHLKST